MKLYHNGHYIKDIPEKYKDIANITDYLDNEFSPRLTKTERKALDQELLKIYLAGFFESIKRTNPAVAEMLGKTEPVTVRKIQRRNDSYWVVRTSNGIEIRCSKLLWSQSPVKEEIKRLY